MTLVEGKRRKVRELLKCPVDWQVITRRLAIANLLDEYWGEVACEYQVDDEAAYITDDLFIGGFDLDTEEDQDYLDWQIVNIESWLEKARHLYMERTRRFRELRMAERSDYSKHIPLVKMTKTQVQQESILGDSLFYSSVKTDDLMSIVWDSLPCSCSERCPEDCAGPWRLILASDHLKLYVEAEEPIGASHGEETQLICLDFDCNTPIVHAYPITKAETRSEIIRVGLTSNTWKDSFPGRDMYLDETL